MDVNKQQQLGIQGQVFNMEKKRMTRSPSFSDWNGEESCAWKDATSCDREYAERSFSMLKNMTKKPRVKIEPHSVEPPRPMNPVVSCVVPKGPRTPRQDPRKFPNQRVATPSRGPHPEHNTRPANSIPKSCLGMKRKEPDADLQYQWEAPDADLQYHPTPPPLTINDIIVKPMDRHFCEVCQISCSSDSNFKQHLLGAAHKAKLEYEERKYSCNLCKIVCPDGSNLNKHLIGKKHMAKKKKLQNGEQKPLHCELCLVSCQNKDIFQAHLDGKPHTAKVKELACRRMS